MATKKKMDKKPETFTPQTGPHPPDVTLRLPPNVHPQPQQVQQRSEPPQPPHRPPQPLPSQQLQPADAETATTTWASAAADRPVDQATADNSAATERPPRTADTDTAVTDTAADTAAAGAAAAAKTTELAAIMADVSDKHPQLLQPTTPSALHDRQIKSV